MLLQDLLQCAMQIGENSAMIMEANIVIRINRFAEGQIPALCIALDPVKLFLRKPRRIQELVK